MCNFVKMNSLMCQYLFRTMRFLCSYSRISRTNANLFHSSSCCHHFRSQNRPEHHRLVQQRRIKTAQNIIGTQQLSISDIDVRGGAVSAQRTPGDNRFRGFCCFTIRPRFFPQTVRSQIHPQNSVGTQLISLCSRVS